VPQLMAVHAGPVEFAQEYHVSPLVSPYFSGIHDVYCVIFAGADSRLGEQCLASYGVDRYHVVLIKVPDEDIFILRRGGEFDPSRDHFTGDLNLPVRDLGEVGFYLIHSGRSHFIDRLCVFEVFELEEGDQLCDLGRRGCVCWCSREQRAAYDEA